MGKVVDIVGSNRVRTASALSTKVCVATGFEERVRVLETAKDFIMKHRGSMETYILDLMVTNGCRVGEVLGIRGTDIIDDNHVYVKAEKRSRDRVCCLSLTSGFEVYRRAGSGLIWPMLNRWYVYRLFRRIGIYEQVVGNHRHAVTHAPRHELVTRMIGAGVDTKDVQRVIGHKSLKSTEYYEQHPTIPRSGN